MNRKEAKEFNDSLDVPVKWQSGHVPPFGGNPWKRPNTVRRTAHIQFLNDYKDKKIKRATGELLCGYTIGASSTDESHCQDKDGDGKYDSPVTCSYCLSLAKRWRKNDA